MAKLYSEAGRVVDEVAEGRLGLKAALYNEPFSCNPRAVCALAVGTLGQRRPLETALVSAGILPGSGKKKSATDEALFSRRGVALVMAYDLLFGQGLRGGGQMKRVLSERKSQLQAALPKAAAAQLVNGSRKRKRGADGIPTDEVSGQDEKQIALHREPGGAMAQLPRYLRINRFRVGVGEDAANKLKQKLQKELTDRAGETAVEVTVDPVVPDVLFLPAGGKALLHGLSCVEDGSLVLQDRSSCLAALAAGITPGCTVLDSCAAPGSKTAHAIDLLRDTGCMIAYEQDPRRAVSLVQRLRSLVGLRLASKQGAAKAKLNQSFALPNETDADKKWFSELSEQTLRAGGVWHFVAGVSGGVRVEIHVGDFLSCDPTQPPFNAVDVVMSDPSCSGSGLPEHHLGSDAVAKPSKHRLRGLAAFQGRILRHALRFPKARTVVYSTCSVHRLENEDVVATALATPPHPPFGVIAEALPWWSNPEVSTKYTGSKALPVWASRCIRVDPATHRCRGFFLCKLDRLSLEALAEREANPDADVDGRDVARGKCRQTHAGSSEQGGGAGADETLAPVLGLRKRRRLQRRRAKAAAKAAKQTTEQPASIAAKMGVGNTASGKISNKKKNAAGIRIKM